MQPSPEQAKIINFKGHNLVVMAYAGSGKTSTLVQYAQENPEKRMLYIAYNRAICDEARSKFPKNVTCKTSHQLAHSALSKDYRHKFKNNLTLNAVISYLAIRNWDFAKGALATLENFLCSSESSIKIAHCPDNDGPKALSPPEMRKKGEFVAAATSLWEAMIDVENDFPMTHDGLLKLYQLSKPELSLFYSVILFDEAQDANPVTTALIFAQDCTNIFVGDRHQQIYRYRGADNALDTPKMQKATRLYLSNCFRFGREIALVANALLTLKGETVPAVGRGSPGEVLIQMPKDDTRHFAVLSRTVVGVINNALEHAWAGKKIYWVGGIESYGISDLADVYRLKEGNLDSIKSNYIRSFGSYSAYKNRAKQSGDRDMNRIVKLIERSDILESLKILAKQTVKDESLADITVATAHRSKGLEWQNVALGEDFPHLFEIDEESFNDEINLLYVAATRAKKTLVINSIVEVCLRLLLKIRKNV